MTLIAATDSTGPAGPAGSTGSTRSTEPAGHPEAQAGVDLTPAGAPAVATRHSAPSRWTGLAALGLVTVGLASGIPTLVLCGLVLATWALLRPRVPGDLALPLAVLGLLLATILTGTLAAAVHVSLLAVPTVLAAIFVLYAGWSAYHCLRGHRLEPAPRPDTDRERWRALAYLPAAGAAFVGLLQAFVPGLAVSWVFEGTDTGQHLLILQYLQHDGVLDYTIDGYPRALHFLVALVAAPSAPGRAHDLLPYDTVLMAAVVWLSLAALLATAAALVLRVAASVRLPVWLGVVASVLLGGVTLLLNSFLSSFVYMGAAPSLLAFVGLWALALAGLALAGHPSRMGLLVLLGSADVLVLMHLWQPVAVVPAAALAMLLMPLLPHRPKRWRLAQVALRPSRSALGVALLVAGCAGLAAIPVVGLRRGGGAAIAGIIGGLPTPPWPVLGVGLVALVPLCVSYRRDTARLLAGSVLGLAVAVAVLLAGAGGGLDVSQYYPRKALWFVTVFVAPFAALAVVALVALLLRPLWHMLGRRSSSTFIGRATMLTVVTALVFAFGVPALMGVGSATAHSLTVAPAQGYRVSPDPGNVRISRERWDIARRYATAFAPAVTVPIEVGGSANGDTFGAYIISKLMSFETGQSQTQTGTGAVCEEIARLDEGAGAVVITQLRRGVLEKVMQLQGCGDVRVVHLPGGPSVGSVVIAPR